MFLKKILPSEGLYCVAVLNQYGGFKHSFYHNLDDAISKINTLDAAGYTCYIAQASFDKDKINEAREYNKTLKNLSSAEYKQKKKVVRGQVNTTYLKSFFLDIDCGEKWPLKNQKEGIDALKKFISDTVLPFPAVVNSGNGLYVYWILDEQIPSSQWSTIAYILKQVVAKYSPEIGGDSSRTADSASVLRIPGTTNRKLGKSPKNVTLLKDAEPIKFMSFVRALSVAAKKKNINITKTQAPKESKDLNSEFFSGLDQKSVPSIATKIADNCAQLDLMRSTGGDIVEPLWYACLGILVHCESGEEFAHAWSKGHAEYDADETNKKLQQWRDAKVGPTTCANLGSVNPFKCVGCKHNGKIKSPIVLGRPDPEKKDISSDQCEPPIKFRRSKDGLFAEQEGIWVKFYDMDLYPERLAFDESLGYETMTIKHTLPFDGEVICTIRSSLVNDPKLLINALADNHIKVVGVQEKKLMVAYLEAYAAKLQRSRRMSLLLCQMGWKKIRNDDHIFVLGKKIFRSDGTIEDASLAKNVPKAAEAYHSAGSLATWTMATEVLDKPGMEPFAFALLAGGFGAPLMKFTGFDGAMVSLVGGSGAGKTLIMRWIQSVWGHHNDLMMLKDDTKNALVSRLGVYGNLPLTVDEVTNITGLELSELVYRVTQGRDKARLTKNSEERKLLNRWNTLAVTSSNASLVDKLAEAKHDVSAEINRVFEYVISENVEFRGKRTTALYWLLDKNYGHAGEVYAQWLVQNIDKIKIGIVKVKEIVDKEAALRGDERFWGALVSAAIYGGIIAKNLRLIRFDVGKVLTWAAYTIEAMRGNKFELSGDSIDILGQFIDEHASCRLVVEGSAKGRGTCRIIEEPKGPLFMRCELDKNKVYISRAVFRTWLGRRFGSYNQVKKDLTKDNILLNANTRKKLGAGTVYGGAVQSCWELDMTSSRLDGAFPDLTETLKANQEFTEEQNNGETQAAEE